MDQYQWSPNKFILVLAIAICKLSNEDYDDFDAFVRNDEPLFNQIPIGIKPWTSQAKL